MVAAKGEPLTDQEIWDMGKSMGLTKDLKINSEEKALTNIRWNIQQEIGGKYDKAGRAPTRYFLVTVENQSTNDAVTRKEEAIAQKEAEIEKQFDKKRQNEKVEEGLYPKLIEYLMSQDGNVRCKQIDHTKSSKQSDVRKQNMWVYPDLISIQFPSGLNQITAQALRIFNEKSYKVSSYEVKINITKGSLREQYFQAVSNSTWANEGYLVAAEIQDDPALRETIFALNNLFGIGVIQLNEENPSKSKIVVHAKPRENIDAMALNHLIKNNADIRNVFSAIRRYEENNDKQLKEYLLNENFDSYNPEQ